MDTPEIAHLKNEIARLNRIIDVLVESNEALKLTIALYENANASRNATFAVAEKGKGNSINAIAIAEKGNGNSNDTSPIAENGNGNNTLTIANAEKGNGNSNITSPLAENDMGNSNVARPVAQNAKAAIINTGPLPETIELNPGNISKLYLFFSHQSFGKVRHSSLRNAAILVLHFYNKGTGAYPTLKRLTGLSQFGLAKYLRSLKKRGLIERNGWQQFKLSPTALHYLKQAGF